MKNEGVGTGRGAGVPCGTGLMVPGESWMKEKTLGSLEFEEGEVLQTQGCP